MWLGLALLAIVLGVLSLAMLLKPEPRKADEQRTDPVEPPPKPPISPLAQSKSAPLAPKLSPLVPAKPAETVVKRPAPALSSRPPPPVDLGEESEDAVTYISNRANLLAELRLVAPAYVDDGAVGTTKTGAVLRTNGAFRATRGAKRERHEDAFCVLPSGVYAIADGAGGHAGGNVASRTAIDAVEKAIQTGDFPRPAFLTPVAPPAEELVGAIMRANDAVWKKAKADDTLAGMGTTLLALRVDTERERVYIAHVGDSRCYRLRDGKLSQLTKDHVVIENDEAGRPKSLLGRAIGAADRVDIDLTVGIATPGDRYVLCTDGLHHALEEAAIAEVLKSTPDLHEAVSKLVDAAEKADGSDNISVVLVEVRG